MNHCRMNKNLTGFLHDILNSTQKIFSFSYLGLLGEMRRNTGCLVIAGLSVFALLLGACENKNDSDEISTQLSFGVEQQSEGRAPSSSTLRVDQQTAAIKPRDTWPRIIAFGDSLTAGYGLSSNESYPALLQQRLMESNYQYKVINAGVSGDTTAGGLRRLDWVLKSRPSLVILELGANDGLRGLPLKDTYANLEKIIQRFQHEDVKILLTGMQIPSNYGKAYTSEFSSMYGKLAMEYNVPLMPFFLEDVAMRPHLNQADGIHPTAEGYEIIVENLLENLIPLLEEPGRSQNS